MLPNSNNLEGFKVLSLTVSSVNQERAERICRSGTLTYGLLKKTASKTIPAFIFIDAATSLCDLVSSYCAYKQAVEKTKQLAARNDALKVELANLKSILELEEKRELDKRSLRSEKQIQKLKLNMKTLERIGDILESINSMLRYLREKKLGNRATIQSLEKHFFDTNISYLQTLVAVV
jgi:hypothetical protein